MSKKNNRASNGYGQDNRKLLTQKNKQKASSSPAATTSTSASTSRASPYTVDRNNNISDASAVYVETLSEDTKLEDEIRVYFN